MPEQDRRDAGSDVADDASDTGSDDPCRSSRDRRDAELKCLASAVHGVRGQAGGVEPVKSPFRPPAQWHRPGRNAHEDTEDHWSGISHPENWCTDQEVAQGATACRCDEGEEAGTDNVEPLADGGERSRG